MSKDTFTIHHHSTFKFYYPKPHQTVTFSPNPDKNKDINSIGAHILGATLEINNYSTGDDKTRELPKNLLSTVLSKQPKLTFLAIERCYFKNMIFKLPTLKTFCLSATSLNRGQFIQICQSIPSSIKILCLTAVSPKQMSDFPINVLLKNKPSLENLWLEDLPFDFKKMLVELGKCKALKSLCLRLSTITAPQIISLMKLITKELPKLQTLDIRWSKSFASSQPLTFLVGSQINVLSIRGYPGGQSVGNKSKHSQSPLLFQNLFKTSQSIGLNKLTIVRKNKTPIKNLKQMVTGKYGIKETQLELVESDAKKYPHAPLIYNFIFKKP